MRLSGRSLCILLILVVVVGFAEGKRKKKQEPTPTPDAPYDKGDAYETGDAYASEQDTEQDTEQDPDWTNNFGVELPFDTWIAYIILAAVGTLGSLFGVSLFKVFLAIAGLLCAGITSFNYLLKATAGTALETWLPYALGSVIGLIGGFAAYKLTFVGVFLMGSTLGAAVALFLWTTSFYYKAIPENPQKVFTITASLCSIATGLASLYFKPFLLIVAMAYWGSFLTVYGVGNFFGKFPDLRAFHEPGFYSNPWLWLWFVWFIVQASVGMLFQFKIMTRGGAADGLVRKPEEDGSDSYYFQNDDGPDEDSTMTSGAAQDWNATWDDDNDDDLEVGPVIESTPQKRPMYSRVPGKKD